MSRKANHPLRVLTAQEREHLLDLSRSHQAPAVEVARAKALLAVSEGCSFSEAARRSARRSSDGVGQLVARFNVFGLAALQSRHGGGPPLRYTAAERARILQEFERSPDRATDGTATWSLALLRDRLRKAPDGLPKVSTFTIRTVLHQAGYRWQRDRSWCFQAGVRCKRKAGIFEVKDVDYEAKKS